MQNERRIRNQMARKQEVRILENISFLFNLLKQKTRLPLDNAPLDHCSGILM